jgi:hypothetical protein
MVARDPSRCESLLPNQRPLCEREVTRWRPLLLAPLEGLEKLPAARAKVVLRGAGGTADPTPGELDLGADFARGVVVVTARGRSRVELGTVAESEAARIAASPQKRARIGLAVLFDEAPKGAKKDAHASLQKLEIELPGEAPFVSPPGTCDCKITTARLAPQRGGEVALVLEGTMTAGARSYKVTLDVATFVCDVVPELPGTRVLPPVHPALPGLDAGLR